MKAVLYDRYGGPEVLHLAEIDKPAPQDDEVLIKVHATGLNAADWRLMRADPFVVRAMNGLLRPKNQILGADVAGVVEAVGPQVTQFQPGDAVYGELSVTAGGGLAEYVCASEKCLAVKPANLSFAQAAAVPMAGLTALQGLRDVGKIQRGQTVLIHGASGGVGTFAVQLARHFGAEVTAVCSTGKMEMARALGATHIIDYTQKDFARQGKQYDLIFVANGKRPPSDYVESLTPTGTFVIAGGTLTHLMQTMLLGPLKSRPDGRQFKSFTATAEQADLRHLAGLLESGAIAPVIERTYPLAETAEAMRHLDAGHAGGKIVVVVASADS